jgi:hypothetical protein
MLSSSEAEYVHVPEAVKEITFIYDILGSLWISVTLLIVDHIDNIGALCIVEILPPTRKLGMSKEVTFLLMNMLKVGLC